MSILDVIIPFKQQRPGDALEPVAEWAKQFEGIAQLETDVVDVFVDNADTIEVPHGLQRNTFGAVIIGVKEPDLWIVTILILGIAILFFWQEIKAGGSHLEDESTSEKSDT